MKVYGSDICGGCRNYKIIQALRGFDAEYVDITASVANLKEFLAIRDNDPAFAKIKEMNAIGIPLFVREDGCKTFEIDEALAWIGEGPVEDGELPDVEGCCGVNGCK